MVTVSADITDYMRNYLKNLIDVGEYKSYGDIFRDMIREKMDYKKEDFNNWYIEKEDNKTKQQILFLKKKGLI